MWFAFTLQTELIPTMFGDLTPRNNGKLSARGAVIRRPYAGSHPWKILDRGCIPSLGLICE